MRVLMLAASLVTAALLPGRACAEDERPATKAEAAPKKEAPVASAVAAQRLAVAGTVTALAAEPGGEDLLLGTSDGHVRGWRIGHGQTFELRVGKVALDGVTADPSGRRFAVTMAKELLLLDRATRKELWRAARPIGYGFSADGNRLITITGTGQLAALNVSDGSVLASRRVAGKRAVLRAVFDPSAALAILGVADG
jgi:hypothetical protein